MSSAEVLFANDAFYAAFQGGDLEAMERLWAREAAVACIHPGWPALTSREEIMASWKGILQSGEAAIACRKAQAFVNGESAFVICYETLGDNLLIATNCFVREGGAWLMVHHQAGPCNLRPEGLDEPEEPHAVQ